MAFIKVTPELAAQTAPTTASQANFLGTVHAARVADLLAAAEAPTDTNTALAAIKAWRTAAGETQGFRRRMALLLIAAGDDPDAVCAGLGIGRTALQDAVRTEGSPLAEFSRIMHRAPRKQKKEVA
ncbi:hypothetical protein [Mycolicibacterium nivoides]|uniref:hypothetical protein n=1 Tax=Mycolicibacterium nivoides TaxID=2487344 RepID=UPI000F5C0ABA|nr:hypothetical protein [Mycolicibacterium nivoides]